MEHIARVPVNPIVTMKNQAIPTLSPDRFKKVYVRQDAENPSNCLQDTSDGYFELTHRCLWPDSIAAHRLDFYMIFLVTSGDGLHTFGSETHVIKPNTLGFAGPEMINAWSSQHHDNSGYVCTFSSEFFGAAIAGEPLLTELPFFQLGGTSILHLSDNQMAIYTQLFEMMAREANANHPLSSAALRSYLHVIVNKARGDLYLQNARLSYAPPAGFRLVRAFQELFMADINVIRTGREIKLKLVSEYAEQLGVSQNHLNDTVKSVTGESAGGLMQKQLMRQATMCLKHSLKNVSEIAYLLGFDDPSYFARFYKRHSGKSPSQVRTSVRKSHPTLLSIE